MEKNPHQGHRQRLKERYLVDCGESLQAHELLEMILHYAIPQKDTNVLAHQLLDKFGSFDALIHANIDQLTAVSGIGLHTAIMLKTYSTVQQKIELEKQKKYTSYDTLQKIKDYILPKFAELTEERLYMMMFDDKMRLLGCVKIADGIQTAVNINANIILRKALDCNAQYVILAHNHPNGILLPSSEDMRINVQYRELLSKVNILLLEHLIVSGEQCVPTMYGGQYQYDPNLSKMADTRLFP